ncbi:MAG: hypothetical protein U0V72_14890 [Cytophagales bacterium]
MKNKRMRTWGAIVALGLATFSCNKKNDVSPDVGNNDGGQSISNSEMTQLIKKLDNPYSVANMQKAYENLQKSNARISTEGIDVTTTHKYIMFKPKTNQELEILKDDTTLVLYSYPMDYEISQGSYYHDPSIPDSLPTYQYCSVPVDKKLPQGVEYEVLENLYIPDENRDGAGTTLRKASDESVTALVDEALRITGNLEPAPSNARVTASSWRPAGRVRVWDDVTNKWRGVEGVIVKARRWFTTHQGMVDGNGNYSCDGTFKRDANYSLDWERYDFALREGWLDGANINGPKKEGNWDNDFQGTGDKNAFHAKVFMAAYRYYYQDIKGLRRPPQNGFWKTQLRIRCHNESDPDANGFHSPVRRFLGLGSAIHIYNQQISYGASMRDVYATTIHELAHASHWNMSSGGDYSNSEDIVAESWARGVQWELTRIVWTNYQGGPRIVPNYTQVVVDMIDGANDFNNGEENLTNDNVAGYTIREIEDALLGQRTWNGWRDNIKNKYNNGTENNMDALFQYWNTFTN